MQEEKYKAIAEKYPDAFNVLVARCAEPEPLHVKHCREMGVPASEMYTLINAAKEHFNKSK